MPLSLRHHNLVSGYECRRIFPAGVGPGSPSRDAANWLPSRFGLSVEMRRRYLWLRMVFQRAYVFQAPIWCPSGGVALYQVGTHQIRRRRRAARSSTRKGSAELLCARIKGANREVSQGRADVSPRLFFFLRGPQGTANGQDSWGFSRMHKALDDWMLARAPASPAQGLHHHGPRCFNFPYFYTMCVALRNLDLLIKTDWSVICPLCC